MDDLFVSMSAVIVSCSLLAWLACRGRQPIILAYFLCGTLIGPAGLRLVTDVAGLDHISRIGITLLLFLAGLVLHPDRLLRFFRQAVLVTLAGSAFTWVLVFAFLRAWGYTWMDSSVAAVALMFSSTILVVKLLPTTALHQQRMGSICIAVLIAEDVLAVVALMLIGSAGGGALAHSLALLPVKAIALVALAVAGERFVVRRMMQAADRYAEVLLMLCLGWCVGIALLAEAVGVPYEVGAFTAGVAMARGKIAPVLSERLKPLRDFFLMFFFFALGATFEVFHLGIVWLPAALLAGAIVLLRPLWLRWLFRRTGEEREFADEAGVRLGQASEFALIIAVAAAARGHLSTAVSQLVQFATILTMLASSYIVVFRYPTPIGVRPGLQRD